MTLIIDYEKCCWKDGKCSGCGCGKACVGCVEACPFGALQRKDKLILDKDLCSECGACVTACKHGALSLE
ncbi:MAG: 4Fe-4S binding protein [archaeon]